MNQVPLHPVSRGKGLEQQRGEEHEGPCQDGGDPQHHTLQDEDLLLVLPQVNFKNTLKVVFLKKILLFYTSFAMTKNYLLMVEQPWVANSLKLLASKIQGLSFKVRRQNHFPNKYERYNIFLKKIRTALNGIPRRGTASTWSRRGAGGESRRATCRGMVHIPKYSFKKKNKKGFNFFRDPFFFLNFASAREEGDSVVVDIVAYDSPDILDRVKIIL